MYCLPKRRKQSHKGDYGRVLIIAGNARYGGAAIMAAETALYSGAGLISLATDPVNHTAMHSRQPEIMLLDWEKDLTEALTQSDVLLMGPGMGTEDRAQNIFHHVLRHVQEKQWLILDASAFSLLGKTKLPPCRLLLTPHLGEMSRLSGLPPSQIDDAVCLDISSKLKAWLILKGHRSKLFYDGMIHENIPGTPAMATGGSGDVLAGMLAGFLAQYEALLAVQAALYLHSHIAVNLASDKHVVLPTEIIQAIPFFMKTMED